MPEGRLLDARGRTIATPRERKLQQAHRALNDIKRERELRLAGLSHDGDRDVYKVAGYPTEYTFTEGFDRYERQHVAGRIVDMPAQTTWRNEPSIEEVDSDPEEETEFEAAWRMLAETHRIFHHWERLDRMAGIGEFAIQLLGFDDVSSKNQLEQEVGAPGSVNRLLFTSEFKQSEVEIAEWDDNPGSDNFGRPLLYDVDLSGDVEGFEAGTQTVHHSRVIHLADSPLDDEVFGRPRLRRVLNLLVDLEKVTAATGESYWQLAAKILIGSVDPDVSQESFKDAQEDLEDDLLDLVHDLRRHFLGQGIELDYLGGDTPDPSDAVEMLKTLIASAAGIPKRILFGSERGELASTQDTREWLGRISERQTRLAEPQVVRPFVDRLQGAGILPDAEYEVVWPNLFEHSEKEKAEIEQIRAKTAKAVVEAIFQGGERGVRIVANLLPDLEEVLEADLAELRRFAREEDDASRREIEEYLRNGGGAGEPAEATG